MNGWVLIPVILYLLILGTLCTMVFARFETRISQNHSEGNLSLYGAIYLMWGFNVLLGFVIKRDPKMLCDIYTPGLILSLILVRLNCFQAGCCLGKLIPGMDVRYPVREIELIFQVTMLVIFAKKATKKKFDGSLYPLYAFTYSIFRFVVQFFREPGNIVFGTVSISHVWSVLAIVIGYLAFRKLKVLPAKGK